MNWISELLNSLHKAISWVNNFCLNFVILFAYLAILAKDLHLDLGYFRVIVSALKFFIFSYVSLFFFFFAKK